MKKREGKVISGTFWILATGFRLLLPICALSLHSGKAQPELARMPIRDSDGYQVLFAGRHVDAWDYKGKGPQVRNGLLLLRKSGKDIPNNIGSDIWTKDEYGDFILELEFKIAKNADSGVFIRNAKPGDWSTALEIQITDSFGKTKPDSHDAGAVYDLQAPAKNMLKAPGEWNQMTITAKGPQLQVALNGERIIDMNLDSWTKAGKNPDGTANKYPIAGKSMPRWGHLELQDHGEDVWFRKIRVKELKN